MKNLPNLYPLRFVLAIVVVIFHLPTISRTIGLPFCENLLPVFFKGELAVYYFFSLSGFLILRIIYTEISTTRSFDFKRFYLRRIARIYPVYYLVFAIGLLVYHVVLPRLHIPFDINYSLSEIISNFVLLVPNVFVINHPDTGGILIVLWSIGIEEQFYLVVPVLLYLFRKHMIPAIITVLSLLLLVLLLLPAFYQFRNFYFYFLFGGLLSILALTRKTQLLHHPFVHISVYALCILSFFTNLFNFSNPFIYHVFNMLVSGFTITLLGDYPRFVVKSRILNYLGKISYGIYMYHMIAITGVLFIVNKYRLFTSLNTTLFTVLLNFLVICCTVLISHLSYRYFESKFYKSNPRVPPGRSAPTVESPVPSQKKPA